VYPVIFQRSKTRRHIMESAINVRYLVYPNAAST
jgi:hypothetical protein